MRRNPVRPILWVDVGIALLLALGFGYVAIAVPRAVGPIERIDYTQSKAVPDFDGGPFEVTDEETLDEFRELLVESHIIPPLYIAPDSPGCAGGTSSRIDITYEDGRTAELSVYDCGSDGSFADRATRLLSNN